MSIFSAVLLFSNVTIMVIMMLMAMLNSLKMIYDDDDWMRVVLVRSMAGD